MTTIPYPFVVCAVDPLDYLRHALISFNWNCFQTKGARINLAPCV